MDALQTCREGVMLTEASLKEVKGMEANLLKVGIITLRSIFIRPQRFEDLDLFPAFYFLASLLF